MSDEIPRGLDEYPITAAESERRRVAYEARRRAYTEAWHAADPPKPEAS